MPLNCYPDGSCWMCGDACPGKVCAVCAALPPGQWVIAMTLKALREGDESLNTYQALQDAYETAALFDHWGVQWNAAQRRELFGEE